jgi:hypothetical protein
MPKGKRSKHTTYTNFFINKEHDLSESPGLLSSMKGTKPKDKKLSVRLKQEVISFMNGIKTTLGNENGYTVSKRGVKKGLTPFTDSTLHSLGKFLGKYDLLYETETDTQGNIIYIFTTKYGDPDDPAEYHELWWNPMEEQLMKALYRRAKQKGEEPSYSYRTDKEAHNAAVLLRKELNEENALKAAAPETSTTEGGTRKRKQKNKQKTKKQRTNRK